MRNIIKKGLILLCFNLVVPTVASSQIILDSIEAKTTALIFNEHNKLSIENPLLKQEIKSLTELNQLYIKTDSIKSKELNVYKEKVAVDDKLIQQLKSSRKNIVTISCVGGICLFILGLIL